MDESEWEWPEAARKKLHPRRGGVEPIAKKVATPAAALKKVAKAHTDGKYPAAEDPRLTQKIGKTVEAPSSAEDEFLFLDSLTTRYYGHALPQGDMFCDYWVGTRDVAFTLQVLRLGDSRQEALWLRLRQRLATADEADYQAALSVADQGYKKEKDPVKRSYLAYAFPERGEWANELIVSRLDSGPARNLLLHSVDDASAAEARLQYLARVHDSYSSKDMLISFVEGAGTEAASVIAPMTDRNLSAMQKRVVGEALSLIPSDEAFSGLLAQIDDSVFVPFITEAAVRWPSRGRRLLAPLSKKDTAKALLSMLDRI